MKSFLAYESHTLIHALHHESHGLSDFSLRILRACTLRHDREQEKNPLKRETEFALLSGHTSQPAALVKRSISVSFLPADDHRRISLVPLIL